MRPWLTTTLLLVLALTTLWFIAYSVHLGLPALTTGTDHRGLQA